MKVIDLIRNEREYPWERTPRQKVMQTANLRYRTYCLLQATHLGVSGIAHLVTPPMLGGRKGNRENARSSMETMREYLGMAAKG